MIEKLESQPVFANGGRDLVGIISPSNPEIIDKINEIIDVVNGFEVVPDILKKDFVLKEEQEENEN